MNIQLDNQYKKLCHIQSIKPGHLRAPIIIIGIILTLLTVGIPLILYWKWQRFRNLIHSLFFIEVEKDSPDVSHYLIVDSFKIQGKSRNTIHRNWIVSPYLLQEERDQRDLGLSQKQISTQICKYIEHKNLRYVIRDNNLQSIKFQLNKNLEEYVKQGLSMEEIKQSINLYGEAGSFSISFFHILKKMLHQKYLRFVFMMFAIKKIIFGFLSHDNNANQMNEKIVSITILAEILLTFLLMFGISFYGAKQHNKIHENLENKVYKVIRKGQQIEAKLKDLYVGDVVIPKNGQTIYFKGILAGIVESSGYDIYAVMNEKLYNRKDNSVKKIAIQSNLIQVKDENIVNPASLILNMGLHKFKSNTKGSMPKVPQSSNLKTQRNSSTKKEAPQNDAEINAQAKFYIIVMDNNFMQRFYEGFKETSYFDNIGSIRSPYDRQQLFFHAFFLFLALIGTIVVSIDEKTHQHWFSLLLSMVVLCFPFNLGLFCNLSEIISIIRLQMKKISVINPMIEQIAIASNLSIELSPFEKLQYRGYIKKSRCNGLPEPQTYEKKQVFFDTYRRTKEESIYALLGWIGIYNTPYFQSKQVYKSIFEDFGFNKRDNEYDQDSNPRIINSYNHIIKIDWQESQRFPVSDMLVESVVIKNYSPDRPDKNFFTISVVEHTSNECFVHFDELVDRGTEVWKDVMQRLNQQGKKIKYICSKRLLLKENEEFPQFTREKIELKSQFMGLLVFDQWPDLKNMKNLVQLDTLQSDGQDTGMNIKIFSIRPQNALIGYDHTLRHANIFHSMQSAARAQQTSLTKTDYQGVVHIGNGILDQGSLLISDISINTISQSYGQADFLITENDEILSIFHQGFWALYNTTLTVVCLVLFNFSKIVGQLVLFQGDAVGKLGELSPISENYDNLFILDFGALILPLILLNLYEPGKKLVRKDHVNFFRVQLMYHAIISLVSLATLYAVEFGSHGFEETCQIYERGLGGRQLIELRTNEHESFLKPNVDTCEGIVNFITVSFAFLVILLMDRQNSERKARNVVVGMINKIYMFLLWIGTIIMFKVPWRSVIQSLVVILVAVFVIFISQLVAKKNKSRQNVQKEQEMKTNLQGKEQEMEQEEQKQRVRHRLRSYISY